MRSNSPEARARAAADLAACAALLRTGSRSFHAASRLLPRQVADAATALYAFCRVADDAVDAGREPLVALDALRRRLDACYAGRPRPHPIDRAFARTVHDHTIPRALPEALLDGLLWDAEGRRYETLDELHAYAVRVAGTVGAMMTLVMGRREPWVLARACDLGVAMQLTNIARDVGEDARMGRLYLPQAELRAAGLDPAGFLAAPRPSPALASVVHGLLVHADRLYARADAGLAALPVACRPGITAARLLYAEIGREVERRGGDSVTGRAVVPARRKAALGARALGAAFLPVLANVAPALPEARFLLEAVPVMLPAKRPSGRGPLLRLLALFERLERLERSAEG